MRVALPHDIAAALGVIFALRKSSRQPRRDAQMPQHQDHSCRVIGAVALADVKEHPFDGIDIWRRRADGFVVGDIVAQPALNGFGSVVGIMRIGVVHDLPRQRQYARVGNTHVEIDSADPVGVSRRRSPQLRSGGSAQQAGYRVGIAAPQQLERAHNRDIHRGIGGPVGINQVDSPAMLDDLGLWRGVKNARVGAADGEMLGNRYAASADGLFIHQQLDRRTAIGDAQVG